MNARTMQTIAGNIEIELADLERAVEDARDETLESIEDDDPTMAVRLRASAAAFKRNAEALAAIRKALDAITFGE